MSVAAIRTAVVALVAAVSGVYNVSEEQPVAIGEAFELSAREHDGRLHFWLVRIEEAPPAGGVGYVELRHRVTVEGYIGVSRDEPTSGERSDIEASRLLSAVTSKLAAAASITVSGTALGSESVTPEPLRKVQVNVGAERHEAHRIAVTYIVVEDA